MKKHILLDLFFTFFKIGMFTFGGGYAMIFIIENTCVEVKKWITHDEMMELTVIAESTPGPIAINCATYIGNRYGKLPGAAAATFGMVLPSLIIIYIISVFLDNFLDIPVVANAFNGIKVGVGILIISAAVKMIKKMKKDALSVAIMCTAAVIMLVTSLLSVNISSIALLIVAGAVSLSVFAIGNGRRGKDGERK